MFYELWKSIPFRQDVVVIVKCFSYILWAMKIVQTSWLQALVIAFYYVLSWLQYSCVPISCVSIASYYVLSWLSSCLRVYFFLPATVVYCNVGSVTKPMCHPFQTDMSHMCHACEMWRSKIVPFLDSLRVGDRAWYLWRATSPNEISVPLPCCSPLHHCRPCNWRTVGLWC
jgi:hypothetical protein